jgi:hypothetical protein
MEAKKKIGEGSRLTYWTPGCGKVRGPLGKESRRIDVLDASIPGFKDHKNQ